MLVSQWAIATWLKQLNITELFDKYSYLGILIFEYNFGYSFQRKYTTAMYTQHVMNLKGFRS